MRATVVLAAALVVVGAGAPFAAAAGFDGPAATAGWAAVQDDDATNESDNETAPGARLAGVASVQGAEVEGEVEHRSFGLQVAAANSNASKAGVVANQTEKLEARLADLQERKETLEAARENGSISASRYRAEMAGLSARVSTLQRLSNDTAESASGLPAEAREEKGVDTESIERLRTSADNLTGPEVAEIARNIAGPPSGTDGQSEDGDGPPFGLPGESDENRTTGPPDDVPGGADDVEENATDAVENATDDVENATDDIDDTTDDVVENATDDVQNSTDDVVENSTDDVEDSIDDVENSTDDVVENATDVLGDDSGDADDDTGNETTTLLAVGADWRVATTPLL